MPSCCFLVLALCAAQTLCVTIDSVPGVDGKGVILTELETTVSLVCRSGRSEDEGAELVWLRNGATVTLGEGNRKGQSGVCVMPVIHQDNGATFTCRLSANATVEASVTLNVTYPPMLSGSEAVRVEDDSPLVLDCETFANPPVSSVRWTLNGSALDLLAGGFSMTQDGFTSQLSADKAEKSKHEGLYRCIADSPVYGIKSRDFLVTVTEKTPKFPLIPLIAGAVVLCLSGLLAVVSRWKKIIKCCK
ncbi:transmembrane and immunoglobulin domain-containing protein 1 isoform X2 [Syngnathoides biaculeatus]|uniref:transmembrane and immunoglobulin domain-containing protein 1 isoform X2 n=1 Tax=Syngnathoides biaculeatus TaxID=300417 RepID=UPI002ADDE4D9|nr:transmembrane and immunoglobulin domain-containing protein 1 isoform X2 [Syngnathoides biaculeatus]